MTAEKVAFLNARLDEDEAVAKSVLALSQLSWQHSGRRPDAEALERAARVLREVEAKRKILARWRDHDARRSDNAEDEARAWLLDAVVDDMAAVYSDHPDYSEDAPVRTRA